MDKIALTITNPKNYKSLAVWNVDHFHVYSGYVWVTRGEKTITYPGDLVAGFIQAAPHPVDDEYL